MKEQLIIGDRQTVAVRNELTKEAIAKVVKVTKAKDDKAAWLQIYCALIAGNKEMDSKSNVVDQTDLLYDLYQQRWTDNA